MWEARATLRDEARRNLLTLLGKQRLGGPSPFHRLAWTLFDGDPEAKRDFLFVVVAERPLTLVVRSAKRPPEEHALWRLDGLRPFAPAFEAGQALTLRARCSISSATMNPREGETSRRTDAPRGSKKGARGVRRDPVFEAWLARPADGRPPLAELAEAPALEWLERQSGRCGFAFAEDEMVAADYERRRIRLGGRPFALSSVLYEGLVTVADPLAFTAMLREGLGRHRAYGFGLAQVAPPELARARLGLDG
ncbi:MAG: type I-E CRISPR-associated protein Cas6/Cse3/CasE [Geminicoccaceae bacterium]|nr:type I-E CRISPR-associated protein Cas6/Cse3/CasE [Geminicoccaceae bacterium]